MLSDWFTLLLCVTVLLLVPMLLSYTLTPFPTKASEELTILTPLAPSNAVPARLTAPVAEVVTLELFAAIEPPETGSLSLCPAVTLSICVSRRGCFPCVVLVVLWPKAAPLTRTEAVTKVQRILFISNSPKSDLWTNTTVGAA